MALKIDFNNPQILRGHLEQALPQYGLEEVGGIAIGKNGGLAYRLFSRDRFEIPYEFRAVSVAEMSAVRSFFDLAQQYATKAGKYAEQHGFKLVSIDHENVIKNNFGLIDVLVYAGIGDATIESVERFEKFLEMIKQGKGELAQQYEAVKSRAREVEKTSR